jgi:hypothetical protein
LCSILESQHLNSCKKILQHKINPDVFTEDRVAIAKGINRLKELSLPICSDVLILKFTEANKFTFDLQHEIMEVIGAANPFGTYELFSQYYNILEQKNNERIKIKTIREI